MWYIEHKKSGFINSKKCFLIPAEMTKPGVLYIFVLKRRPALCACGGALREKAPGRLRQNLNGGRIPLNGGKGRRAGCPSGLSGGPPVQRKKGKPALWAGRLGSDAARAAFSVYRNRRQSRRERGGRWTAQAGRRSAEWGPARIFRQQGREAAGLPGTVCHYFIRRAFL